MLQEGSGPCQDFPDDMYAVFKDDLPPNAADKAEQLAAAEDLSS